MFFHMSKKLFIIGSFVLIDRTKDGDECPVCKQGTLREHYGQIAKDCTKCDFSIGRMI